MNTPDLFFELSGGGEQVVRSYQCTEFRQWFSRPTIGYLTITNKRIVFHSVGKSLTGQSYLVNEMPIEDVAGISVYKGVSINWIAVGIFALIAYFMSTAVLTLFTSTFWAYLIAFLLILPHAILWLLNSNILENSIREQAIATMDGLFNGSFKVRVYLDVAMRYTRYPFNFGLLLIVWGINKLIEQSSVPFWGSLVLFVAFAVICFNLFGRGHTFSLLIGSKTMKDSGILISGNISQALSVRNNTALQTLSASPSVDAEKVTREIGALIMDIKHMGDLGIRKWMQK